MYSYPNYYPNYQQNYQQPVQQPIQQPTSQILAWVRSEDEGVNFPLNAGQSIFLMNQNEPYLYMKSVDQLGKTTFLKKRLIDESETQETKDYVRREEIEDLIIDRIQKEVEKRVSEISFKPTKSRKSVVVEDED